MTFKVQDYITKIETSQGKKDYLPLQGRLLWFTGEVTEYVIETEIVLLDIDKEVTVERMVWDKEKNRKVPMTKTARGIAVYHATLAVYKDGSIVKKVPGDKMETAVDFPDYLEKAQSGAIGRCLMFAGYGTAFAIELDEGERLTDSPVERTHTAQSNGNEPTAAPAQNPLDKAKTNAIKVGFITGQTKEQLKASWDEQIIQLFGSRISDEALAKPANLARVSGSIEAFSRQRTSGK